MASTLTSEGSVPHPTNDVQLRLSRIAVSGFADIAAAPGNFFAELDTDESHRQRCALKLEGSELLLSEQLPDTILPFDPSSLIYCELWRESEDQGSREKLCECTVTVTEAICEANPCEHKTGQHEWSFQIYTSSIAEYQLPLSVDEPAEGLIDELHQTFKALHVVSDYIPRLSGDLWMYQQLFDVAWRMFTAASLDLMGTAEPCRAALDDALKETLTQLRLGLTQFSERANRGWNSRRGMYWADGLDLVNRTVVQAAALLDKYTKGLNSASSRIRSLFLDRCQDVQDDIIRYRIMFIQNRSASKRLERGTDPDPLIVLMSHMVASTDYDDVLLSLRGRLAGRALELLQDGIPNVENYFPFSRNVVLPPSNVIRQRLRSLFTQVAQASERVPPSLLVDGVKWNAEVLSRGKFSDVTAGLFKKERVVIKRIKVPIKNVSTDTSETTKKLLQKALEWRTVRHERLLALAGVAVKKSGKDSDGLHLVFPRMEQSGVLNVLGRKNLKDSDKLPLIHRWILEIAEAIVFLHGDGIVHGDLRARNVLVDRDSVRVTDFGLLAVAEDVGLNFVAAHPGLARWHAPELLTADAGNLSAKQTFASDVYAFACVCVELYTGTVPFAGVADKQIASTVAQGTRPTRPTIPGKPDTPMDEALWNILQRCWAADPLQRPTALELLDDLYFFVHGEKRQTLVEDAPAIFDEPEGISERSPSPETVSSEITSPPETPLDTPMFNIAQSLPAPRTVGSYSPIVEEPAKAVNDAVPDDAPAPYPTGDPSHGSSDSADSDAQGALADDEGSTASSGSNATSSDPAGSPEVVVPISVEEQKTPEINKPVVIVNQVIGEPQATTENPEPSAEKPRHEEIRTTHEPEQAAQEPITSDTNHEQQAELIINDTPLAGPTAVVADVPEGGLEKPESDVEAVIVDPTSVVPVEHEEATLNEAPDAASPAAPAEEEPVDLLPAAAEIAAHEPIPLTVDVPEEPAARNGVSSEAVRSDVQGASAEEHSAPDSPSAHDNTVEANERAPSSEGQEAENSHVIVEMVQANASPEETTPEPSQPEPAAKPVETKANDMTHDAAPASTTGHTEAESSSPAHGVEEIEAVDEAKEVHEVHTDAEPATAAPAAVDEHVTVTEDHVASETSSPAPAATVPGPASVGVDAVEEPVVEEKHEEAISTLAEPAPAVEHEVEKESEETVKPSEAGENQSTSEPAPPVQPPAIVPEAPSETPALVAEPDQHAETEKPIPEGAEAAPTIAAPIVNVVDESPQALEPPADQPAEDEIDDSELAPPPNVITKDDSVFRRGSVRLVTPPPPTEDDELPKVVAMNPQSGSEGTSEPQPEAKPEPQPQVSKKVEDSGIQQESRNQQPATTAATTAAAAPAPANGDVVRKTTTSPKPKNGKKTGKDADDVPGCCAKCVIM